MAVAVARPGLPWLGWLTLPPIFLAVRYLPPLRAAGAGLVWGASLFLFSMLFRSTPIDPSFGALALLAVVPSAYTGLGSWLTRTRAGFSPLLLATAWIGVEYALRPLSLRYGLLIGDQTQGRFLHAVSGLLGYGFVSFVIAYVNGLLLTAVTELRWQPPRFTSIVRPDGLVGPSGDRIIPCPAVSASRSSRPRAPPVVWSIVRAASWVGAGAGAVGLAAPP